MAEGAKQTGAGVRSPVKHRPDQFGDGTEPVASGQTGKKDKDDPEDDLKEERLHMVIDKVYGSQGHYRAAKKFLKNRTLRKMNKTSMTLYDRIMAYRKLKDGDEVEEGYTKAPSPDKPPGGGPAPAPNTTSNTNNTPQRRREERRPASNNNSSIDNDSKSTTSDNSNDSPAHKYERSDTSFASVDIPDLDQLDEEEKNRTPTPQPTFEDPPYGAQAQRQTGHDYEEKTTARDVQVEIDETKEEKTTERRSNSASATSSAVTTATVATVASSQRSSEDRREERVVKEDIQQKETVDVKREEKVDVKETHNEKHVSKEEVKDTSVEKHAETAAVSKTVSETSDRSEKKESVEEKSQKNESQTEKSSSEINESKTDETSSKKEEVAKTEDSRSEETSSKKEESSTMEKEKESSTSDNSVKAENAAAAKSPIQPEVPESQPEAEPVVAAAVATAAASAPRRKTRPKSAATKKKEEEEDETIAALDKLATSNLNSLMGKDGADADKPEIDQKTLDKVFNPKFQAELDDFLRS